MGQASTEASRRPLVFCTRSLDKHLSLLGRRCAVSGRSEVGDVGDRARRRTCRAGDHVGVALMKSIFSHVHVGLALSLLLAAPAKAEPGEPDLLFRKSTTFKLLTPNDKLAVYGVDDPAIEGVACHFTAPERGGLAGAFGLAEQTSDVSLACRQYGPIKIKEKFEQGDVVFRERRSLFFKKMQIVRGCDVKRNVLVYMAYTDKLIEGSPKNSTSSVPIQPWGTSGDVQKCGDFLR
jgi:CreA protein